MKPLQTIILLPTITLLLTSETAADILLTNRKGKIKSIIEQHYEAEEKTVNGKTVIEEAKEFFTYYYLFDERGNITEENSMFGKIKCVYNDKGYRVAEYTTQDSVWHKTCVYVVSNKGKFIRDTTINFFEGTIDYITTYKYNDNTNNTEQILQSPDGTPPRRLIYKYDDKNRRIEDKVFNSAGEVESIYSVKYNGRNLKKESKEYSGADSLVRRSTYTYDDKDNIIEFNAYDSKDNLLENYYTENQYEYDSVGNWIKNTSYSRGSWVVLKRKIEYY